MGKGSYWWKGILVGLLATVALSGLMFVTKQLSGLPFAPFDLFDWMVRHLPGNILTLAIGSMVKLISGLRLGPTASTAKLIEQSIGIIQFIILGAILGLLIAILARRWPRRSVLVGILIGIAWMLVIDLVELSLGIPAPGPGAVIIWFAILFAAWGWLVGTWARMENTPLPEDSAAPAASRRNFLAWLGGGAVLLVLAGLGLSRKPPAGEPEVIPPTALSTPVNQVVGPTNGAAASPSQADLAKRVPPIPGTRSEITPNDSFYRIDINTDPQPVDLSTWKLQVGGMVNNPLQLTLTDLQNFPPVSQVITLECISNYVGGDLISTTRFTGTPVKNVLQKAGLKDGATYIQMASSDGFYETMPISEAMDERTLLVYAMNGEQLPVLHGFPLRIYIPNHYGMKQPKWLDTLDVSNLDKPGFWVDRGWSKQAVPHTTSVIDTVVRVQDNQAVMAIGGIAYAGARGITKVEVQLDQGNWQEVQLRNPPLSPLSWVQWRYEMPYMSGRHTLRTRAYDGSGEVQESTNEPPEPNGSTGYFSYSIDL